VGAIEAARSIRMTHRLVHSFIKGVSTIVMSALSTTNWMLFVQLHSTIAACDCMAAVVSSWLSTITVLISEANER